MSRISDVEEDYKGDLAGNSQWIGVQGMDQNHTEEYFTGLERRDPCFRTRPLIF